MDFPVYGTQNQYLVALVILVLILYASFARPELPPYLLNLFYNPIFQILLFTLILYHGNRNPLASLMIAVVFMLIMNLLSQQKIKQDVQKLEAFTMMRMMEQNRRR